MHTIEEFFALVQTDAFHQNVGRVRNLLSLYRDHLSGQGQGRRPVHATDVLRAAVVLLHATIENLLRSLAVYRIPQAEESVLNSIPLIGLNETGRVEKFFLGRLARFRGQTVDDIITRSVDAYYHGYATFNNTTDIATVLRASGLATEPFAEVFPQLDELLKRRHQIVHNADRNPQRGTGHHWATSLGADELDRWIGATTRFADEVMGQVRNQGVAGAAYGPEQPPP